jgi:cell division transport system permease protein
MLTVISRIIHYGIKSFWRNKWLSTATVVVMVLALTVSVGLVLFNVTMRSAVLSIKDKVDISVYFQAATAEDEILRIKKSLEELSEIKTVDYISRDEALETFTQAHQDEPVITQALQELDGNPLEASLRIKANDTSQYATIAQYLKSPQLEQFISDVSYEDNQVAIDRLTAFIGYANRIGLAITVLMALIAGIVVYNTIRLAIYSNRDEIGIMRLVGASNPLVRGPYVVEGMIQGALAAVVSLILVAPLLYALSPGLSRFIPELNLFEYYLSNLLTLFFYQVLLGLVIGSVSSFVAVRRYLRK